ncbi:DUF1053 domain-containing protein [Trichonephila clavipes]|nr:DUF1053 domain-containing protein [Trichonephila clavipes]
MDRIYKKVFCKVFSNKPNKSPLHRSLPLIGTLTSTLGVIVTVTVAVWIQKAQRRSSTSRLSSQSCSTDVASSHTLRVVLFVIVNSFIFASSFINMVICVPEDADLRITFNDTLKLFSKHLQDPPPHCLYGQHQLNLAFLLRHQKASSSVLKWASLSGLYYGAHLSCCADTDGGVTVPSTLICTEASTYAHRPGRIRSCIYPHSTRPLLGDPRGKRRVLQTPSIRVRHSLPLRLHACPPGTRQTALTRYRPSRGTSVRIASD